MDLTIPHCLRPCLFSSFCYLSEPESTGFLNLEERTGMEVETNQKSGLRATAEKALCQAKEIRLSSLECQHSLMIFNE